MGIHHRAAHRILRLALTRDRGSAIIEGTVALAVAFLLLTLVVQVAFVIAARNAAESAVAASARRAARPGADLDAEETSLDAVLAATVPGAHDIVVGVDVSQTTSVASASFEWDPPGPDWLPIIIRVESAVPVLTPP